MNPLKLNKHQDQVSSFKEKSRGATFRKIEKARPNFIIGN